MSLTENFYNFDFGFDDNNFSYFLFCFYSRVIQKQPPRRVPRKRCSENIQQINRRTPMPKCDFNSFATLLKSHIGMDALLYICCKFSEHLFLITSLKNTSGRLLLVHQPHFHRFHFHFCYLNSYFFKLSLTSIYT